MEQLTKERMTDVKRTVLSVAVKQSLPRADLEDLVQDTLLHLILHPPKEIGLDSTKYFMGAVRRQAFQKIYEQRGLKIGHQANSILVRNNTYSVGLYQEWEEGLMDERILPSMASAEDVYMASLPNKRQQALQGAIDGLPDDERTAIALQTYEELSLAEIASRMGISHQQVRNLLEAARKRLRAELNPKGKND